MPTTTPGPPGTHAASPVWTPTLEAPWDLRVLAVRPDCADIALEGLFVARRYAVPHPLRCTSAFTAVRAAPGGEETSELLRGETFMVLSQDEGWAWGWCAHDHYVGYVESAALGEAEAPAIAPAQDPVEAALRYLGMSYYLAGRGGRGIDCSGLMQRAFATIGVALPRDSDMQKALGLPVHPDALRRGDLVGFPGHIGIMTDSRTLLHATAGRVMLEPLADVARRTPIETRARLLDNDHAAS